MTTYSKPDPVTNLTAKWQYTNAAGTTQPGIALSWTAPTVTSGTLGEYWVYVLLYNNNTNQINPIRFGQVRLTVSDTPSSAGTYTINPPATTAFFPFNWKPKTAGAFPYTVGNQDCYSFQVVSVLLEENDIYSVPTGVTVFRPAQDNSAFPMHLDPRFDINASGESATLQQDSYTEVASCVELILNTEVGTRTAIPQFGVIDPTFSNPDPAQIRAAIRSWEPRATVDIGIQFDDSANNGNQLGAPVSNVSIKILDINGTVE